MFLFIFFFFHFFYFSRKKRALSDWLIVPHTKWCGRGQTADNYSQLGGASKADKCCRRHDHCKFNIYAMTTKWRLFNYRPFTISHCSCDMRLDLHLRYREPIWFEKLLWATNYYWPVNTYSEKCTNRLEISNFDWLKMSITKA